MFSVSGKVQHMLVHYTYGDLLHHNFGTLTTVTSSDAFALFKGGLIIIVNFIYRGRTIHRTNLQWAISIHMQEYND